MRLTSLITILVFVAGLGIGYFARSAVGRLQQGSHAADLPAIEKLHQEDIEATVTQDPSYLTKLWSDDGISLGFPGPPAATYRTSAKDNPVSVNDKGMRLLKRQSDGSWKFALVGLK